MITRYAMHKASGYNQYALHTIDRVGTDREFSYLINNLIHECNNHPISNKNNIRLNNFLETQ